MRTCLTYMPLEIERLDTKQMVRSRGDVLRLADVNIEIPGYEELGLFAVPTLIESTGDSTFLLVDGISKVLAHGALTSLVNYIVRNFNEKASLTDVARAML